MKTEEILLSEAELSQISGGAHGHSESTCSACGATFPTCSAVAVSDRHGNHIAYYTCPNCGQQLN